MNHEPFDTLAATYAVGALDGADRAEFERHLAAGCDVCEETLRESAEALAALARQESPAIPPPEVKDALLRRTEATTPVRPERPRTRPPASPPAPLPPLSPRPASPPTFFPS